MYEIKAIVRLDRKEGVIAALHAIADLPGLTVSNVEGVGRRHTETLTLPAHYGRAAMAKVEIVVGEAQLEPVLQAIAHSAHTGRHGDGKVFVYRVDRVVRLRTGETDAAALS